ncbi:MAG TPA: hypothetical protein VGH27_30960 [Streptosporangiaceae bacterium]
MVSPALAQTHAPAVSHTVISHTVISHTAGARPDGEIFWFSGDTYPDTAAGLAACNTEGTYERAHGVSTYSCWLGNPDAGLYGLWLGDIIRD